MKKLKQKFDNLFYAKTEHCLYWLSILLIPVILSIYGITYFAAESFGLTFLRVCSMRTLFGIPCPGCGGTRAIVCLFTGRVFSAIYYNAFVVYAVVLYLIFFITQTLERLTKGKIIGLRFRNFYWQLALVILVLQYIAKFIIPDYQINL